MSSTTIHGLGKVESTINILYKNGESIVMCQTIDYKDLKIKNIEELEEYIKSNLLSNLNHYTIDKIKLEKEYLSCIIARYSKEYNNEHIEWDYKYGDLSFQRMNKLVNWTPITIEIYNQTGGIGSAIGTIGLILTICSFLEYVYKAINIIKAYINPYKYFEKRYGIDKNLIHSVIKKEPEWDKGFIDKNDYTNKNIYERKIMKDCCYKYDKKNRVWRKKYKNDQ